MYICKRPSSPLTRTLYNPHIGPLKGVVTKPHVCKVQWLKLLQEFNKPRYGARYFRKIKVSTYCVVYSG